MLLNSDTKSKYMPVLPPHTVSTFTLRSKIKITLRLINSPFVQRNWKHVPITLEQVSTTLNFHNVCLKSNIDLSRVRGGSTGEKALPLTEVRDSVQDAIRRRSSECSRHDFQRGARLQNGLTFVTREIKIWIPESKDGSTCRERVDDQASGAKLPLSARPRAARF